MELIFQYYVGIQTTQEPYFTLYIAYVPFLLLQTSFIK